MGNKQKHSSDTKQYKIKRSRRENKADTIKVRKHPKLRKVITNIYNISSFINACRWRCIGWNIL